MERAATLRVVKLLIALVLFACTGSTVVENRGTSPYRPVNEEPGGRVRYALVGWNDARREDAYRDMFQHCHGQYEISSEFDEAGDTTTMVQHNQIMTSTARYHVIDFKCVARPAATTAVAANDWNVARNQVAQQAGCPSATAERETAPSMPGVRTFQLRACGQVWLCNVANAQAACSGPSGASVQQQAAPEQYAAPPSL